MKNLTVDINSLYSDLELTQDEVADMSVIFNSPAFKNVLKKIIQIKSLAIVEEIEKQDDLDRARFTLIGNKEVYSIFEKGFNEYSVKRQPDKFDEKELIEEV